MENKKYILTEETMEFKGRTLHRIKAIRDFGNIKSGDLGGWVEKESNLSHEGDCWIFNEAKAVDNSKVKGNARMYDCAEMYDNSAISGNAEIHNNARMYDCARLFKRSKLCGWAVIRDHGTMSDDSVMSSRSQMLGNGRLRGNAELKDTEVLYGALFCKVDKFIEIPNPKGKLITGVLVNGDILYNVGCQEQITKETFIDRIYNEDGGIEKNLHRAEYLKIIDMIEGYLKD